MKFSMMQGFIRGIFLAAKEITKTNGIDTEKILGWDKDMAHIAYSQSSLTGYQ